MRLDLHDDRCLAFVEALEALSGDSADWNEFLRGCEQLKEQFSDIDRAALDADVDEYVMLVALEWPVEPAIGLPLLRAAFARDQPALEWLHLAAAYVGWTRRVGAADGALDDEIRERVRDKLLQVPEEQRAEALRLVASIESRP